MRIGLDATPLIGRYGGIPRYVTELAAALAQIEPDDEIHLLSDQTDLHVDGRLEAAANVTLEPPARRFGGKWWSTGLAWELRRRRIDVFHGTNFEVPYLPAAPSVMTVHDLSPWREPPVRPPGSGRVRRRAPWLLRRARRIVTPSEAIRAETCTRFRLDDQRVIAIPLGAPPDGEAVEAESSAAEGPYLLYLGDAGARKNLETAVEGWRRARESVPRLRFVLAGAGTERFRGQHPSLQGFGSIEESRARALLAGASVFVYPSLYEGFGLPVVEAMRAGAPVIISGDPALVETAGGAALRADAADPAAWGAAMVELLSDPAQMERQRRRGIERARDFDWRRTAARTRAVYERAIGGS